MKKKSRKNQLRGKKAARTRARNKAKITNAAKKGWQTRAKIHQARSRAAKKAAQKRYGKTKKSKKRR